MNKKALHGEIRRRRAGRVEVKSAPRVALGTGGATLGGEVNQRLDDLLTKTKASTGRKRADLCSGCPDWPD